MKRIWIFLLTWAVFDAARAQVTVRTETELRQAVAAAKPGARILMAAGEYRGGFHFQNLRGAPNQPIVIAAADPQRPPLIKGGASGMQLSACSFVELHHLTFTGATGNGLNIDDGGAFANPARHIILRGLKITDVGPRGNRDGIKLSGLVDFRVEDCTIERWGDGGSGIDMVGCHRGVIEGNRFRHQDPVNANAVQTKGGTSDIVIRRNRFENPGGRAVNIGGSTDPKVFRPPLRAGGPHFEARNIRVEGNTFIGSLAPINFVGVDGAVVRCNTIYRPKRWAIRILQETQLPGFVPSRNGEFTDNIIVFHASEWSQGGVNVGANTAPETFQFARNWWYCLDAPARSRPTLPVAEGDGVHGRAPMFRNAEAGDLRLQPGSPARKAGAEALPGR